MRVPQRYATLFSGLKLKTPINTAVLEPLTFLVRRFMYAAIIVLLGYKPVVALSLMIVLSIVNLVFTVVTKPWMETQMQILAVVNESIFLVTLGFALGCSIVDPTQTSAKTFCGTAIIIMMSLLIVVNFGAMATKVFQSASQMLNRKRDAKTNNEVNNKKIKNAKSSSDKKVCVVPNFNGIEEIEELEECQEESRNSKKLQA